MENKMPAAPPLPPSRKLVLKLDFSYELNKSKYFENIDFSLVNSIQSCLPFKVYIFSVFVFPTKIEKRCYFSKFYNLKVLKLVFTNL